MGGVTKYIIDLVYPVGSIYISIKNTNPQTYMSGTTWVAWGSGRVPVGVNTGDSNFNTVEKTGGEKTHTLTVEEMPSHNHAYTNAKYLSAQSGQANYAFGTMGSTTDLIGESTRSTGGGQAHNNLQPYITCYMWKRTA